MAPAPLDEAAGSFPNPQSGKRDDRRNFLSSLDGVFWAYIQLGFLWIKLRLIFCLTN